jgi:hypothetical protein
MISGLLGLAFNPAAWLAIAIAFCSGWAGGTFKAWGDADADNLRKSIVQIREASQHKDEIIRDQSERYLQDQEEAARLQERLNDILASTDTASACKPTGSELERLRGLSAAGGGKRLR